MTTSQAAHEPAPGPTPEAALEAALVVIERLEGEIRAAQAEQMRQVAEAHRLMHAIESHPSRNRHDDEEFVRRAMTCELATTLRVHERSAGRMLHEAAELDTQFTATRDALAVGAIGFQQVRQLLDTAHTLPEARRGEFEAAALDKAAKMTPPAFRRAARRLRERMHPIGLVERHTAARGERHIELEPAHDGMAWLHLHVEAERGAAIMAFARRLALRARDGSVRHRPQPRLAASRPYEPSKSRARMLQAPPAEASHGLAHRAVPRRARPVDEPGRPSASQRARALRRPSTRRGRGLNRSRRH
ncbi:DUF222 domain-containing protein [Agromyces neolithicus]|uniref:DUF222 domain-containing protein n=1 Tax=Agromyces neolithicus TaxID=269420 RepID=A0ABN2ME43_9MICO